MNVEDKAVHAGDAAQSLPYPADNAGCRGSYIDGYTFTAFVTVMLRLLLLDLDTLITTVTFNYNQARYTMHLIYLYR
ncbi:hypothetical protein SeMB42_g06596 [Synchytrium endobioticum]|uniref:Uncharacterized protein n=1 Tax=Synchytrium endobioticum TaxID=286115 RepID=A0A507CK75_9FUNG|nr:hypothetical protein SeMB42_g06596 [Synchytrium endobioticum]